MKILTIISLFLVLNSGIIENDCVDNVKIGMDISEFLKNKSNIYNVKNETISLEGDENTIYNVYNNSELIYAVEPNETGKKVWRIWLYGKDFKTEFGIGVGNTLGDLKEKYKIQEIITGEGNVAVIVKEIKVSFLLNTSEIPKDWWDEMKMDELKNDLSIELIII